MKCYLCGTRMTYLFTKHGYRLFKCPHCGLGQTEFTEDYEDFVKRFYSKGYFTGDPRFGAFAHYEEDRRCIQRNTGQALSRLKKLKKEGRLLDVGCAMGFFVEQARHAGYDAYGFDPSEYAVKKAKKKLNGRIEHATVHSASYPEKSFDFITLFDVFEHLADPVGDIRRLRTFLKDDGHIVIATGNTDSLAAKILREHWTFYIPPQHLFFFTKSTLETALSRAGFTPVKWFGIGKWLSVGYVLHLAHAAGDYPLADTLFELVEKLPIRKVPLFVPMRDNQVVIARKSR